MSIFRKIQKIPCRWKFEITRYLNQRHRYDYPPENKGWEKMGCKPVFGDETTGTIYDPFVYLENKVFVMIASERSTGNLIRLESTDGQNWKNKETILNGVKASWEETVNRACIVYKDNTWHLFYTGRDSKSSKIGYAKSIDGLHFERQFKAPIVIPEFEKEGESVMNPHVIWNTDEKIFQMWYSAGQDYEPDVLFYAESTDGLSWKKHQTPILEKTPKHPWEKHKIGGCFVFRSKGKYQIYYIGYQNVDVARICFATSDNGIEWFRDDDNLILSPSEGMWDSDAVYKPSFLEIGCKAYLWYNGRSKRNEYIGLAIKNSK